jgi:hypothetical protein
MTRHRHERRWQPAWSLLATLGLVAMAVWLGKRALAAHVLRAATLLRHLWAAAHPSYLRWRLETFGLYEPSYLHQRRWWQVNYAAALTLLCLLSAYVKWMWQMAALREGGAPELWREELGSRAETWRAALRRLEDE